MVWDDFNATVVIETHRDDQVFTCTGIAITPTTILTAAHCADGVTSMRVSFDSLYDADNGKFIDAVPQNTVIHPGYHPAQSLFQHDLAFLELATPAPDNLNYPRLAPLTLKIPLGASLERIGYGGRNGENRKTWTTASLEADKNGVLVLKDALSVEGDSGGPVYYRVGDQMFLVAIHSTQIPDKDGSLHAAEVKLKENDTCLRDLFIGPSALTLLSI